ncbi:FAD-dependent oxidoreductase [Salinirubrum litoreum]|uniref:FAD-dependent oxidoreductase n=1 Tax=Salinirubrum litoreum TaxID=1126234 RepID=A0ABD5R933_9EURY|nr:FAD-dependent oxidoreductase [Salinirubrum litoreum]
MTEPFVVVGGDAGGLSAASKFVRESAGDSDDHVPATEREVIVFERGQWVSYAHCGTPYFVKGEIDHLSDLLSLSPDDVESRGIDLRRGHEVVGIDTDAETVTVAGPSGDRHTQSYGDLLLATGARAITDPIPGTDADAAFTIHGLDSAAGLRALLTPVDDFSVADLGGGDALDSEEAARYGAMDPPETVAVVGGGYVGIEMCEALAAWDVDVHLFQRADHVLPAFGEAVAEVVEEHLREQGITLHLGEAVDHLEQDETGRVSRLVCTGGTELAVGAAVVGVGVRPNVELAEGTDIELGESGAIATDEFGRTSVAGVYAVGDCAEMHHVVTGDPAWVPLGLTANRAGRAVGQTVAGDRTEVGGIAGTAVLKAFEQECGRSGITDLAEAREAGFDPVAKTITAGSRSGYYPGSEETTVRLVADRETGRLLGGSIVGRDRAAIRIDTVATALEAGMTVGEVERLDLAYAPPFSPVWDPVLVCAKVLAGALSE